MQVTAIKNLLFPEENLDNIVKNLSDSYYKYRLYLRSTFILILLNLGLYLATKNSLVFTINFILLPVFILAIEINFRKRYYLFNSNLLLVGQGVIETHKTYLPFFKVQNVKLKQTIFQVRKNVADIVFQTASGKVKIPCIQLDKAQEIYNYTLFKVETSQKSWM